MADGLRASRRLNATLTGSAGETIVFGNGFGTDQHVWNPVRRAFRGDWRFVQFDHVGMSRATQDGYSAAHYTSLDRYADDLLALLDDLGIERCRFVGHSVSGMVGCLAAIRVPERFGALVLIGASPRYLNDRDYEGGFEQADIDALFAAMAKDYLGWAQGFSTAVVANPDEPALAQQFASFLATLPPEVAMSSLRTVFASDHRDALPRVAAPTLVLQATADIAVPEFVGRYIAGRIPGARFHLLNYTGHMPHLVAPAQIGRLVETFLLDARTSDGR